VNTIADMLRWERYYSRGLTDAKGEKQSSGETVRGGGGREEHQGKGHESIGGSESSSGREDLEASGASQRRKEAMKFGTWAAWASAIAAGVLAAWLIQRVLS
jgi:hypothetical protein